MRTFAVVQVSLVVVAFVMASNAEDACPFLKSRGALTAYEAGGPYKLEHFKMTKDRKDLREFLWNHWHNHVKGVVEAKLGTVDAGTVTLLYIVEPDAQGLWGINVELDRPKHPPCITFHADSLVRIPIRNPDEDYPSQTLTLYLPNGRLPSTRLEDSETKDARYYRLVLVTNGKATGDTI